jgi:phage-related baseplate assembly protein
VTLKDYETMAYAMPSKFGALKRIKAIKNPNPRRGNLNIAVIAEDADGYLTEANLVLKDNLRTWLDKGRMVSDVVEITDAKIINFGINFTAIGDLDKNRSVILQDCIDAIAVLYSNKAEIGEALYITDVYKTLKDVDGVIDVVDVGVITKNGSNYSSISFDINDNLSEDGRSIVVPRNVIYEIKYPTLDIKGAIK